MRGIVAPSVGWQADEIVHLAGDERQRWGNPLGSRGRTVCGRTPDALVVTVALGSTLATILLNRDVSLAEEALALALLVVLQLVSARASVRSRRFRCLIKAEPTLLLSDGRMLNDAMAGQRVTESEVLQAIRSKGIGAVEDVTAVILETNGRFSVLSRSRAGSGSSLHDVRKPVRAQSNE